MHKYVVMAHADDPLAKAEEIRSIIEEQGSKREVLIVDDHTTEGVENQRYDIIAVFAFGQDLDSTRKRELDDLLAGLNLEPLDTVIGDDHSELAEGGELA